jgi:hypothetical protein
VISPVLLFLLRVIFAVWGLLCFHMNFWIDFSTSVKSYIWDFDGIVLNLVDLLLVV